jgi:pimeloyl-ACP methyl ester carboxylesterase
VQISTTTVRNRTDPTGDRGFESVSLQRRVSCEPGRGRAGRLDALDIAKALFWGYSMGGWIGFGIAKYAAERVHALVIGGRKRTFVPAY